jgi:hypothetical protein
MYKLVIDVHMHMPIERERKAMTGWNSNPNVPPKFGVLSRSRKTTISHQYITSFLFSTNYQQDVPHLLWINLYISLLILSDNYILLVSILSCPLVFHQWHSSYRTHPTKKKEEKKNHIKQTVIVISRAYLKKDNKTKKDIYLDHVTLISYPIIICFVLFLWLPIQGYK